METKNESSLNRAQWVDLLKSNHVDAFDVGELGLISIFDDTEFSNIDFDIVTGSNRQKIQKCLIGSGWKAQGSRIFSKEDIRLGFPKPSHTLGCNPADKVIEAQKEMNWIFVTPTQALLTLMMQNKWDLKKALKLTFIHAPNLEKLAQWVEHDRLSKNVPQDKMLRAREQGLLKRKGQPHQSMDELFKSAQ